MKRMLGSKSLTTPPSGPRTESWLLCWLSVHKTSSRRNRMQSFIYASIARACAPREFATLNAGAPVRHQLLKRSSHDVSRDVTWPLSTATLDWSNPGGDVAPDVVPDVTVRPAIDCHPRAPTLARGDSAASRAAPGERRTPARASLSPPPPRLHGAIFAPPPCVCEDAFCYQFPLLCSAGNVFYLASDLKLSVFLKKSSSTCKGSAQKIYPSLILSKLFP